jgi:hypothetical protein
VRGPKNSDINTLTEIVSSLNPLSTFFSDRRWKKHVNEGSSPPPNSAVVIVSVYNRLAWSYNFVYRSSQHAALSSNTLGELYNIMPCPSKELPDERTVDEKFVGYESGPSKRPGGCVVVIEGTVYGDGLTDYARCSLIQPNAEPDAHPDLFQHACRSCLEATHYRPENPRHGLLLTLAPSQSSVLARAQR